ncbi:MAG: tetratricopeptide repeat protein, partial [Steroidobacteraceae bacterium]
RMYPQLASVIAFALLSTACSGAEERKVSYLHKGETYFNEQNYDKASVELRNALQIDPKYVDARYLSGRVAEKRGELREAVGQYQAAVDENPKYSPARAAIARLYLLGGLPEKARELVDIGLKDDPQNPALLTVRAGIQAQAGRMVPALADAEAAYKLAPKDEFTIALLASLYKQNGNLDNAVTVVTKGSKDLPKSVDLHVVLADLEASRQNYSAVQQQLEQVIALEPTVLAHRGRLSQFYLYRKDVAGAEAVWRKAIKDLPHQQDPKLALIDLLWSQQGEVDATKEMQVLLAAEPKNADLKLSVGSYLQRQNKLDDAENIYQEVIYAAKLEPAGLSARNRLAALVLGKNNDVTQAQTLVGEVLKENAHDNDALILRANMALQKGDAATAITDLRGVLRDQPNSVPLMRALAKAHLQNREVSLAEETLRGALQSNPGDIATRKDLSQLLLQQGKGDQARALLDQLASVPAGANDVDIIDAQFKAQIMTKDYAAAMLTAEKLQQLKPSTALGWYFAGLAAEGQKSPDVARKQYETALEKQPDGAEPLAALIRLDVQDKQIPRALQRLDKVIAASPKHAVAYNLRGELLLSDKQLPRAIESFGKAVESSPSWWAPYRGLALSQLSEKQIDAAVVTYQRGIEQTKNGSLSIELAALLERMGKPDDAIKVYEQWLQREPKSPVATNNLAMLMLNYRNDKASIEQAGKLVEQLTTMNEPALLDTRGWAKYKAGDFQGAVNLLQQAANVAVDSSSIHYHLGMAQWKMGDIAAARITLQVAIKDNKPFFGLEEAKKTLASISEPG